MLRQMVMVKLPDDVLGPVRSGHRKIFDSKDAQLVEYQLHERKIEVRDKAFFV